MQKNYGLNNLAPAFVLEVRKSIDQAGRGSESLLFLCCVNAEGRECSCQQKSCPRVCHPPLCRALWLVHWVLVGQWHGEGWFPWNIVCSLYCSFPAFHKPPQRRQKKGGKKPENYCVSLPSLSQQPWQAHKSEAELVSAAYYFSHNFLIILRSLHDRKLKTQGEKSGLSAFIPYSAIKILFVLGWHV